MSVMAALVGCGTSDASDPPADGPIGGCSLRLSGGTSGTYPCTLRAAVWSSLNDVGQILVGRSASAEAPAITAALSFLGEPLAGTYADDDPDLTIRMTVTAADASWTANAGGSAPKRGSFTMVVTSATATKATGDNQIYAVSGTLEATLSPVAGTSASGDVAVEGRF
jgi:hypothetical protein